MWKDIPGFEGLYKVNEDGEVMRRGKLIKQKENLAGYFSVGLHKNGKTYTSQVHRLVLMAFSPCEGMEDLYVHHKDHDPSNNNVENLQWVTLEEHHWLHRTMLPSENKKQNKKCDEKREQEQERYDAKETIYIESIASAVRDGLIKPAEGRKFWCFTKYVADAIRLEALF